MNCLNPINGLEVLSFGELGLADARSGFIGAILGLRFMRSMVVGFMDYPPLKMSWMSNLGFFEWW